MEQFFSKTRHEERFTQLGDIPKCSYCRENFTTTNSNIILSDYFPTDYKKKLNKLITLVKENKNNIDMNELSTFILDIEIRLNSLKKETGLYNMSD